MLDLKQLKYFIVCAETGSISEAAKLLYTTQPSVSKAIKALEEEMGIVLFERMPRGIALTAKGREVIDAGTTTGYMIDFLPDKKITFVTNAFVHAKKLAQRGFKVYMPAGEIKLTTEAIVGAECVSSLQSYNFTKSFLGANGISLSGGITTPDRNEARVKSTVVLNSQTVYILADHSKFDQISAVTFAQLGRVKIITDKLQDKKYLTKANIKEVM